MKTYFSNPRHNKAAWVLATMSPDMVADIVDLVNTRGSAVISDVKADDGPPRPLSCLSSAYISDTDFPEVFLGLTTIFVAAIKSIKADSNFYAGVLSQAFSLPSEYAQSIAARIETKDYFSAPSGLDNDAKAKWYKAVIDKMKTETAWYKNLFKGPSDIMQQVQNDQSWDVDFLYEVKLLGDAVSDLQSKARLQRAQISISSDTGYFAGAGLGMGDVYGDVYGDPVDVAEVAIVDTMKPLMGTPLPFAMFGGLGKLAASGLAASRMKLAKLLGAKTVDAAGNLSHDANPVIKQAVSNIANPAQSKVAAVDGINIDLETVKALLQELGRRYGSGQGGSNTDQIREQFGDVVAECVENGDLLGAVENIVDMAAEPMPTTGDPHLDEAIITETLNELDGDPDYDDSEAGMGGLFKKARIKRAIKKGRQKSRKGYKAAAKQSSKDLREQQLRRAQFERDRQNYIPSYSQLSQDDFSLDSGQDDFDNPVDSPYASNDTDEYPNDFYNVDQFN